MQAGRPPASPLTYVLTAAGVGFTLILDLIAWPWIQPNSSPLFFAVVVLASWYGGLGPGLVATVLAAVAGTYFFIPPSFALEFDFGDVLRVTMFVATALLVASLNDKARAARRSAEELARVRGELLRQAEAANQAKNEFLGTLSHELRTPLNVIVGWLSRLSAGDLDEATRLSGLEAVKRNARTLEKLIGILLDMSQMVSDKLVITRRPVDVAACVQAAVAEAGPAAAAKSITVELTVAAPGIRVSGDAARLTQIAGYLLDNAIQFTPEKGRIDVRLDAAGDHARIVVCDTGQGIAADRLPRLFEYFQQAESTVSRTHGGLGLGLAIVRHLVSLHGGRVEAASEGEGRGATFTVELPLALS